MTKIEGLVGIIITGTFLLFMIIAAIIIYADRANCYGVAGSNLLAIAECKK